MAVSPGFFRKNRKRLRCHRLAPKGKGILMGVSACIQTWISAGRPGMTQEWKGETVQMPEAFGIKSGKSPNFGQTKARQLFDLHEPEHFIEQLPMIRVDFRQAMRVS
jgi:hypothetical protein